MDNPFSNPVFIRELKEKMNTEKGWTTPVFLWRKMWKNCGYVERFIISPKIEVNKNTKQQNKYKK